MSPLLRKEIRLLLPNSVLIVCLLGLIMLAPRHFNQNVDFGLVGVPLLMVCPILATLMVIGSLGREISPDMIGRFLSQPIARARLWWMKTSLLALFLAPLWWGWWLVFRYHFSVNHTPSELGETQIRSLVVTAALLAGGLWSIVLVRSTVTAFWMTILAPSCLTMLREGYLDGRVAHPEQILITLLAIYSFAGLAMAFRLFVKLQDVGPAIQLESITDTGPAWLRIPAWFEEGRVRKPALALLCKEARFHQGLLSFAFSVALMHLGIIALRSSTTIIHRSPTFELLCTHFWVIWLILPVLIGCQLFAEERRLGVWESQLTLPYRRSRQLLMKGIVAGVLAICLGALMPVILEQNKILTDPRFEPSSILNDRARLMKEGGFSTLLLYFAEIVQALPFHPQPLATVTLAALGLLLLSGFASSLTRTLFQALTAAFAGVILVVAVGLSVTFYSIVTKHLASGSPLGLLLLIPAVVAALLWLTARNASQVEVGPRVWVRNAMTLMLVLLAGSASASLIYHRAWERLTPWEPPHGAATLRVEDRVRIQTSWRAMSFTTADGRAWSADHSAEEITWWDLHFGNYRVGGLVSPIFQFEGSNWAQLVHCAWDTIGIQKDGSLWVSDEPPLGRTAAREQLKRAGQPIHMVQFGKNQDWKQAARFRGGALLLATNGTLWVWEKAKWAGVRGYQGLGVEVPSSISSENDWTDLHETSDGRGYGFELLKKDGSAWIHPAEEAPLAHRTNLDEKTELSRVFYLDSGRAPRRAIVHNDSDRTEPFQVGINRDSQLEIVAAWQSSHDARRWSYKPTNIPLGKKSGSPWIDVASAGDRGTLITLRADGTLWKWRFPTSPIQAPETANATRLGIHSDWVALAAFENEIITLAADGSLWAWQFESPFGTGGLRLLAPSSKPRLLGNILAGSR